MPKRQLRRSYDEAKGFKKKRIHGDRKRPRLEDVVELANLIKKFKEFRLVGPLVCYAMWWFTVSTKDGRQVSFPKPAVSFNPETGELDNSVEDPYRDCQAEKRLQVVYLHNAIDRATQENEPKRKPRPTREENESGFKVKESDTWTPVEVIRVPPTIAQQMQDFESLNRWKKTNSKTGRAVTRTFDISHPRFGRDISIAYDKDASSPGNYYNLSLSDKSPLTEEEMDYLIWDIEGLANEGMPFAPDSIEEARLEAASLEGRATGDSGGTDNDGKGSDDDLGDDFMAEEDDDDLPWGDTNDSSDGDDDDLPDEFNDVVGDEEPKPTRRRRKRRKGSSTAATEGEKPTSRSRRRRQRKLRSET